MSVLSFLCGDFGLSRPCKHQCVPTDDLSTPFMKMGNVMAHGIADHLCNGVGRLADLSTYKWARVG